MCQIAIKFTGLTSYNHILIITYETNTEFIIMYDQFYLINAFILVGIY